MKEIESSVYVEGSSALKPDCSRYSNENEHIITFPGNPNAVPFMEQESSVALGGRGKHAAPGKRDVLKDRVRSTDLARDIHSGTIKGKALCPASKKSMILAGALYVCAAVVMIYFGA